MHISCGTCFIICKLEYISLSLNVSYKGFNFLRKGLKNNLENIFGHALNREFQALSAQPLHLRLIWSAKLAKAELSQFQFDLNSAKRQPDR